MNSITFSTLLHGIYRKARKFRGLNFRAFTETGKFCNIRGKKFRGKKFSWI